MTRKTWIGLAVLATAPIAWAQVQRPRIDVEHYVIAAEINPGTQSLSGVAQVRFIPEEDRTYSAVFELHNALNVSKVEDEAGRPIPAERSRQDFSVRLNFQDPLVKGKPTTVTFHYDGTLSGREESPVYGIRFAAIQGDHAYLLYPARW